MALAVATEFAIYWTGLMADLEKKKPLLSPDTKRILKRAILEVLPGPAPLIGDLIEDLQRSRVSIDEKIRRASESLQETSRLINELDDTLKERTDKLAFLRQEVERYTELAEVEEGKAKALIQQVDLALRKGRNIERVVNLIISLVAGIVVFILGLILSPVVQRWLGIGS
jgi:hypothetical protein